MNSKGKIEDKLSKGVVWLLPLMGLVCIFFSQWITMVLPYILGIVMILIGVIHYVFYFRSLGHKGERTDKERAYDLIYIIMGFAFLFQGSDSLVTIGVTWGIIGVSRGAEILGKALAKRSAGEKYMLSLADAAIKLLFAIILLFAPFESLRSHIMILGFEILFTTTSYGSAGKPPITGEES